LEEREIRLIRSAFEMAEAGKSVAQIEELLGRYNVKITREEIASIVIGREQRQRKTKSSSQRSYKSSTTSKEDKDRMIKKSDSNYKHNLAVDLQETSKVADSTYKDTISRRLNIRELKQCENYLCQLEYISLREMRCNPDKLSPEIGFWSFYQRRLGHWIP
jgi:hypothetical protein